MATVLTELEILQLEIRRQEDIIQTMKEISDMALLEIKKRQIEIEKLTQYIKDIEDGIPRYASKIILFENN